MEATITSLWDSRTHPPVKVPFNLCLDLFENIHEVKFLLMIFPLAYQVPVQIKFDCQNLVPPLPFCNSHDDCSTQTQCEHRQERAC